MLSSKEIQSRLASLDKSSAKLNGLSASSLPAWVNHQTAATNLSTAMGAALDQNFQSSTQQMLGSKWEAQLVTPNLLQAAGLNPTMPFAGDPTSLGLASPLRGLDPR